jgi:hypothetical protein
MKKYCFDTSGISNPLDHIPDDIHVRFWNRFSQLLESGDIAITREIYDEMEQIRGAVGDCIRANRQSLILEIADNRWNWRDYINNLNAMHARHQKCISEYANIRRGTVGLNDISIICLAKTLNLPLVSMEIRIEPANTSKRRIPNVCDLEGVEHLTFNDCLRREGIVIN